MRRAVSRPGAVGTTLFLYDQRALSGEAEGWLAEVQGRPASVRGRLFRGPRGRLGLVPDPKAPLVRGSLVEVTPAQLPVLDFLFGGVGGALVHRPLDVIVNLRTTRATAWVLTDVQGWKPVPQERV